MDTDMTIVPDSAAEAFAAMQYDLPTIPKTRAGFNFKYAPIEVVMKYALPVLKKHGFCVTSRLEFVHDRWCVRTDLIHNRTGVFATTLYPLGEKVGKDQEMGKAITYGRRYGIVALLCLSIEGEPDVDDSKPAEVPVEVNF